VDPRSASEIRAALENLLASPALREELRSAGMARARSEYRWEHCGRRSLEFFARV
jgi:glycosyltransferase involved in cell wall biosynthesis